MHQLLHVLSLKLHFLVTAPPLQLIARVLVIAIIDNAVCLSNVIGVLYSPSPSLSVWMFYYFLDMWIVDFGVLFNFSGESWVVVQKVAD